MPEAADRVSGESDDDASVERDASTKAFVTVDLQSTHVPNTSKNSADGGGFGVIVGRQIGLNIEYDYPARRN
jgi:hypothetical protein